MAAGRDVVKADHRALIGNTNPGFGKRANRAESSHIVKSHQRA